MNIYRKFNVPVEIVKFANDVTENFPFVWGEADCVWIARRGWEIVTGEDIIGPLVPDYNTHEGAVEAYKLTGPFQEQLESIGGYQVPMNKIVHGDLVFAEEPEDGTQNIGLVCGRHVLVADEVLREFTMYPALTFQRIGGYVAYRAP